MKRILTIAVALILAGPALAGDQPAAPDLAKKIAPLVDAQTFAVAHLRLDKLDAGALVKLAAKVADLKPAEAAMIELPLKFGLGTLKNAGAKEVFVVATLEGFPFDIGFAAIPAKEEDGKKIAATLTSVLKLQGPANPNHSGQFLVHQIPGFVLIGPKHLPQRLAAIKTTLPPHLDKALAAFAHADAQVAVVCPDTLRRSLGEMIPTLPSEFGGGKSAPLLKGYQYFAIGYLLSPKLSMEATLQAGDAKAAAGIRTLFVNLLKLAKKEVTTDISDPKLLPMVEKLIALHTPKLEKDRLTWKLTEEEVLPVATALAAQIRAAAGLSQTANSLKQIGIALHVYHDVHKQFPIGLYDKQGKPLLSWRVQILPYLEQQQLYQQFKLEEPWDSLHNKQLIPSMPAVFRTPFSKAAAGKTTFLGPFGKGLFFNGAEMRRFQDIMDGTSNTIMLLEVNDDRAVTWTKPEDLFIDPKQPLQGLGGTPSGKFHAAFADGSIHLINSKKLNAVEFYKFLTIAGGESTQELP